MSDEHSINDPLGSQSDSDAPATPKPEETAKYWRDKYNGLNGHAQKLQSKLDKALADINGLREESEGSTLTLKQQAELARKEAEDAKKLLNEATAERDQLKTRAAISKSIRENFPQLASAFDSGLILGVEMMDEEARTEYLSRYAEHFAPADNKDKGKDKSAGSLPTPLTAVPPRKEGVTTRADAAKALQAAYVSGGPNSPEYKAALNDYKNVVMQDAK